MKRELTRIGYAAIILLLLHAAAVAGQVGALYGRVVFKQANGEEVPIEGAIVEAFRNDIPGKYKTLTDKKGRFIFAGLPFVGNYTLAVSAPVAQPDAISDVKAGREVEYKFTLEPGDGKQLTMEEARAVAQRYRINEGADETLSRMLRAGNSALSARHFDEAIKSYDEGIAAAPGPPNLLTILWSNKSVALRSRGLERYNELSRSENEAVRALREEAAKKDFKDAAEAAAKALEIFKTQAVPAGQTELDVYNKTKYVAFIVRAEAMRLLVKLDPSEADEGLAAFEEFLEIETDPLKRIRVQLDAAWMLLEANLTDKAAKRFKDILSADPENMDATAGFGMALFKSGDRNKFSEAASYLQKFIDTAPDTHALKQTAREALEKLKASK